MKITAIQIEKITIPLDEPFKVAIATLTAVDNIIIRIVTDEGIEGYGEAAPTSFVTGENAEGVIATLKDYRKALLGKDPLAIEEIHKLMNQIAKENTSAKCAIDLALHDILGKKANLPLYKLLGGYRNTIQCDYTIGIDQPEKMALAAKKIVEQSQYRILKIKTGISVEDDIRAIAEIRKAVGPAIRLRVDANQGYDRGQAIKALRAFEIQGVEAVEQCLPAWDFEGAAALREQAGSIRMMADESVHGPKDALRLIQLRAVDIINIKLMKCGGILPALAINAISETSGIPCMVGCMMETKLAIAAGAHLSAAKANIIDADLDSFLNYRKFDTGVEGGFEIEKDTYKLLTKPGLGIELNF